MNTSTDLLIRLLELFPVKLVKDFSGSKKGADDLAEDVVANHAPKTIENFAFDSINNTRQHIHIFNLDKKYVYNKITAANCPLKFVKEISSTQHSCQFACYSIVEFKGVLLNPSEDVTIKFYQPFLVTLRDKHLIIQATMLEKNISSYIHKTRRFLLASKKNVEEESVELIRFFFEPPYEVTLCDLNKGIKKLWHDKIIDARKTQSKKGKSVSMETMDEDFTLREQYPEAYEEVIKRPLHKHIFQYMLPDDQIINHFTVDPIDGKIHIPLFPKNPLQVETVINKILSGN